MLHNQSKMYGTLRADGSINVNGYNRKKSSIRNHKKRLEAMVKILQFENISKKGSLVSPFNSNNLNSLEAANLLQQVKSPKQLLLNVKQKTDASREFVSDGTNSLQRDPSKSIVEDLNALTSHPSIIINNEYKKVKNMRYRKQSFEVTNKIKENSIDKETGGDLTESRNFEKNQGSMLKSPSI